MAKGEKNEEDVSNGLLRALRFTTTSVRDVVESLLTASRRLDDLKADAERDNAALQRVAERTLTHAGFLDEHETRLSEFGTRLNETFRATERRVDAGEQAIHRRFDDFEKLIREMVDRRLLEHKLELRENLEKIIEREVSRRLASKLTQSE